MSNVTKKVLTDKDLESLAAEAERGYDVARCPVCKAGVIVNKDGNAVTHEVHSTGFVCPGTGRPTE